VCIEYLCIAIFNLGRTVRAAMNVPAGDRVIIHDITTRVEPWALNHHILSPPEPHRLHNLSLRVLVIIYHPEDLLQIHKRRMMRLRVADISNKDHIFRHSITVHTIVTKERHTNFRYPNYPWYLIKIPSLHNTLQIIHIRISSNQRRNPCQDQEQPQPA
jgi:hypothetical protein